MRARQRLLVLLIASAGLHGAGIAALGLVEGADPAPVRSVPTRAIEISFERVEPEVEEPPVRSQPETLAPVVEATPRSELAAPMHRPTLRDARRIERRASERPAEGVARLPEQGPEWSARGSSDPDAAPEATTERPSLLAMRSRGERSSATPERDAARVPDLSPERVLGLDRVVTISPEPERSPLELAPLPRIPGPRIERSESMMTPDGNGTYRYDHSGFSAKVERDGTVAITDKPSFQPFFEGPCLECARKSLGEYVEDPSSGVTMDLMGLLPRIGVRFDLTDWIMRQNGDDPYSYEKARFLDNTRAERETMRRQETDERLREALQVLPGELARIWDYDGWTRDQKKRALFDLWDECAESGPPERVRLGRSIRVTILAFIRRRLPAGSEHAYTAAELEELNRGRTSKERFAPYRVEGSGMDASDSRSDPTLNG